MTTNGRIPRSMKKTPTRLALVGAAVLIAVLAAVLFTGQPVSAQNPAVTVSFGQAAYTVAESDDTSTTDVTENQVEVTVSLSADPQRQVIIPIVTNNQDDTTSADYAALSNSVTFDSGEIEKTITFTAAHDRVADDGDSVKLSFGSPLPADVTEGTPNETVVTITDDDPAVTVAFGEEEYTVAESDDTTTTETENEVEITVTLSEDPQRQVIIPIETTDQGDASSADYTVPTSVTFDSGEIEISITFTGIEGSEVAGSIEL